MKRYLLPALLILAPAPCLADEASAPTGATAQTSVFSPARLAAAQTVAKALFPEGTYARIMDKSMGPIMDQVLSSISDMPLKKLAGIGGVGEDKLKSMGNSTLKEMMAILDPAYEQRMKRSTSVMFKEMSVIMTRFEPSIRDGLTQAYASRYDERQLAELSAFFATPTGASYAADSMTIFMDPAVMAKMQAMIPQLMQDMPTMIQKVEAATADMPKARSFDDLTPAERRKLAALLGVPESELDRKPD